MQGSIRWAKLAFPYVAILMVAGMVWGHTVKFQFVWDDTSFIQKLDSIRSFKNVPAIFSRLDAQSNEPKDFKLFRPLRTVHYAFLYWLGGGGKPKPRLYHGANIAWHTAAALLLYAVTARLFLKLPLRIEEGDAVLQRHTDRCRSTALWVALAFAAHPVVSEVVCWAKSLDDSMAAVFTLAAVRSLLKWDERKRTYAAALCWFVLAIYSKISAVPFALAAFLIFLFVLRLPWLRSCRLTGGFIALAAAFMAHRHWVIGQSSQTIPISGTHLQTLIDMLPVAPKYLRLLCGVPPFCIDYSYMTGHYAISSAEVMLGAAAIVGLTICALVALRTHRFCLAGFGIGWAGLFLIPVSNLLPMMQYMAERFLYLPLIGFLWASAVVARSVLPRRTLGVIAPVALAAWTLLAWDRSWIWQDELTLFVQSSRSGPKTTRVNENALIAIFNLPHLKSMFTLDEHGKSLRLAAAATGEKRQAIEATLLEANRAFPDDEVVATALGMLYASAKQPARAVPYFRIAVERKPNNTRFLGNLGQACLEVEAWNEAEAALTRALELAPQDINALRAMSQLCWKRGLFAKAARVLNTLAQLEPANPEYAYWIRHAEAMASR